MKKAIGSCLAILLGVSCSGSALAEEGLFAKWLTDLDISGFVRQETASRVTSLENPANQYGNLFNGVEVERCGAPIQLDPNTFPCRKDTVVRPLPRADNPLNMSIIRSQLDLQIPLSNDLTFFMRGRGIFDIGAQDIYDEIDPSAVGSIATGPTNGDPNYYRYFVEDGRRASVVEWAGEDYMVDIPALYMTYQNGPLMVRAGNQQIAWGQSIYFRVLDVPNGLDMRRHLVLDYAVEEFADERVPSPGVRASYTFNDSWEVEAYVQKFQSSIYPNANTPYNFIPSAFTVHDLYGDYRNEVDRGMRIRGKIGPVGVQLMAADRMNPDGVFRWTESGVNRDLPGLPGSGDIMARTAYEADVTGVHSATEWFTYAGWVRLDGLNGLNASIEEFPATAELGAAPAANMEEARRELDWFFQVSPLRGHIARDYKRERNYGAGLSYVFEGEPGSLFDQLIVNLEGLYQKGRTYTNTTLSRDFLVDDELTTSLVLEKYYRFSRAFPATYIVGQWMHRDKSDMFGRHLSGMGGDVNGPPEGGLKAFDAYVLAFVQPFPNLVWRADLVTFYDGQGGLLVQPYLRWKPNGPWTVELFSTHIEQLSGHPNKSMLSTVDYADEVTVRLGYQF